MRGISGGTRRFLTVILGLAALFAGSAQALADCVSPAGPAGRIEYFSSGGELVFKYCNGTDWVPWAGEPVSGIPAPSGGAGALSGLTDVDVTGAANGNCLVYNNGTSKWEDGACGAGGDNLGDHTATQDLAMGGNDILNAATAAIGIATADAAAKLHVVGDVMVDNNTDGTNKGCIRFDGGTNKLQFSHDCTTFSDMGGGAADINGLTDGFTDYATDHNVIIGRASAAALTSGAKFNTFIGEGAGATSANSTANTDSNTAVGYQALAANTSGHYNAALGYQALNANTTGFGNVAVGLEALGFNTTGNLNIAIGQWALTGNTVGYGNVAIGYSALNSNKAVGKNTAIGQEAMNYANNSTTVSDGNNTALGYQALYGGPTASANTGTNNVALGATTLAAVTSGGRNVAVGSTAGDAITTGSNNIVIGYGADTSAAGASNEMNIGNTLYGTGIIDGATRRIGVNEPAPQDSLHVRGAIRIDDDAVTTDKGCIRFDGGTDKLQFSHDCTTFTDMGGGGGGSSSGTAGYIQFSGGSGAFASDNAADGHLFWNSATHRLGIGTASPAEAFHLQTSSSFARALVETTNGGAVKGATYQAKFGTNAIAAFGYDATVESTTAYVGTNNVSGSVGYPFKVRAGDASGGAFAGGALYLEGGSSSSAAGGAIDIKGGTGGTSSLGGAVTIAGGNGGFGGGGSAVTVTGGSSGGAASGGTLTLQGGSASLSTAGSAGGTVAIAGAAGSSSSTGGAGGGVTITGGNAQGTGANAGGAVTITAGNATSTGADGAIALRTDGGSTVNLTLQAPTATELSTAVFGGTSAITLPGGTDAQRPDTGVGGMLRYNTTATPNDKVEYYDAQSATWVQLGSGGGGDNLGNHTATLDLAMGGNDITGAADIFFSGVITDTSDIRLKTDINPLGAQLSKIAALDPISFRMKDPEASKHLEYGFSAQQVQAIYPDLVIKAEDEMGTLSLNYQGLIAPMAASIRELKALNDAQAAKIETLETTLASLTEDVKGLKGHTGYGTNKAEVGLGMLGGMGLSGIAFLLLRRRRK